MVLALVLGFCLICILYLAYDLKVQTEVRPTVIAVTVQDIPPYTQIEEGMLTEIELPARSIPPTALHSKEEIIGKWTQVDFGIPNNSFFYENKVVTQEELLDAERMKLGENKRLYTMTVDLEKSAAGNIIPNVLVDIWFTGRGYGNEVVSGRVYQNVQVIGAKNRQAENIIVKNVSGQENKVELFPTIIQLAVSDDQIDLLAKAEQLGQIRLVPKSGAIVRWGEDGNEVPVATEKDPYDVKEEIKKLAKGNGI
ncbi:Flp pilus assembly protein CpaB [Caldalkalibacillus mannanilyticus]|uniref:Flp pilus assembly protein CpaB n=1 Tax=Caldalkalibacillus mannanilyticus TaxID=1418 RepID=UPI001F40EF25|nr:RcpC/CpaB family pilus assembly protein [Caldalkalibacillus mannanilyticus]